MTQLSPTALKAARVAWLESASDYTRLDTSISAAITAYLAQREKEGWMMVPVDRISASAFATRPQNGGE